MTSLIHLESAHAIIITDKLDKTAETSIMHQHNYERRSGANILTKRPVFRFIIIQINSIQKMASYRFTQKSRLNKDYPKPFTESYLISSELVQIK